MAARKHTPGPWEIRDQGIYSVTARPDWAVDEDDAHERVCVIQTRSACSNPEGDLPLIAAAPTMLTLLGEAASRVDDLVRALGKSNIEVEDLAAWSDDARELLARIDGDTND